MCVHVCNTRMICHHPPRWYIQQTLLRLTRNVLPIVQTMRKRAKSSEKKVTTTIATTMGSKVKRSERKRIAARPSNCSKKAIWAIPGRGLNCSLHEEYTYTQVLIYTAEKPKRLCMDKLRAKSNHIMVKEKYNAEEANTNEKDQTNKKRSNSHTHNYSLNVNMEEKCWETR